MTSAPTVPGRVILVLSCLLLALAGCERTPHLASGPFDIGPQPRRIQFDSPVTAAEGEWELCFEFNVPGDSHRTGSIEVMLLSEEGGSFRLATTSQDRRGEGRVCLIGRVENLAPGVVITAVNVVAPTPLRVRHLSGGNRDLR